MSLASVTLVQTFWKGFVGFGLRQFLQSPRPLLFLSLRNVHSFWMLAPIEVIELSETGDILQIRAMKPFCFLFGCLQTKHILEAKVGFCRTQGWRLGDRVLLSRQLKSQ